MIRELFIKLTLVLGIICIVAGCRTALTERSSQVVAERRLLNIEEKGKTKEAFASVCKQKIDSFLAEHKFTEAKNLFWNVMEQDKDVAWIMLGRIESRLLNDKKYEELVEWCERLLVWCINNGEIKDEVFYPLMGYMIESLGRIGRHDAIIETLYRYGDYLSLLKRENILTSVFESFVKNGRYAEAHELIEASVKDDDRFDQMIEYMKIYLASAEGKLQTAENIITNNIGRFSDDYLTRALKMILPKAVSLSSTGVVENICELVVSKRSGSEQIMDVIAGYWIDTPYRRGERALLVSRLSKLFESGTSIQTVKELYCRHATFVLQMEKETPLLQKMLEIGERLLAAPNVNKRYVPEIELRMMDVCFLLERYDRAKEIFDQCKNELADEDIELLDNKMLAHIAMKYGNYEEALQRFKVFTDKLRNKRRDEYDHIHGEKVPYEALMGLNMKRIGDLFVSTGNHASADKAYEEAKNFYHQAIGKLDKGSYWRTKIEDELKVLSEKVLQSKK